MLGVLADDRSNTLWVCQNATGGRGGAPVAGQTALRSFDLTSGAVVLDHGGAAPAPPASVAKILTATALLAVDPPTTRLRTSVVGASGGTVVLVGGGDPTLTGAPAKAAGQYAGAADRVAAA